MQFCHSVGEHFNSTIYYEVIGNPEGQPLLFLHGGVGQIEDFNGVVPAFSDEYKIIGIDSRGHGSSYFGKEKLSYVLMQRDVEAILTHLGIKELDIIGFSDGGTIAYRLAAMGPIKVKSLITIGSTWHSDSVASLAQIASRITGESWKAKFPHDYENYQRLNPQPDFDRLVKETVSMWLDTSAASYPNEQVEKILAPLLAIRGENDPLVSEAEIDGIQKTVKGAKKLSAPSAGHMVFVDQPELFISEAKRFLKAH